MAIITIPTISRNAENADRSVEQPKALISIVERGKGKEIIKLYNSEGVSFHYQTIGHGTATSEIMDILGLDSKDKDVVISFSARSRIDRLVYRMSDELRGAVDTKGILFDFGLSGMTNMVAAAFRITAFNENKSGKEEADMACDSKHSLILISVNQGYTENVLDAARKLGARGGTIVRARWSGDKDFEKNHRIALQTEKEIIIIVVPNDIRNQIMDAVNAEYGLKTEAGAVVCSTGIDHFAPI